MANNNLNNNNELFLLSAEWLILAPLALYRFTFLGGDADATTEPRPRHLRPSVFVIRVWLGVFFPPPEFAICNNIHN